MKFTFKTTKPTGPYSSFSNDWNEIKLNKKVVGNIGGQIPFTISLYVMKKDIMEDGNKNCEWKHVRLKKQSETLQEAKDFLNANIEKILQLYTLKQLEE